MPSEFTCVVNGANVDSVGNGSPVVSVVLTDLGGSFGPTQYNFPDSVRREMLATALAAISTASQVDAIIDPTAAAGCLYLGIRSGV